MITEPTQPGVILVGMSLDWQGQTKIRGLDQEEWEHLRAMLPANRLPQFDSRGSFFSMPEFVADLSEANVWIEAGFTPQLTRVRGLSYAVHPRDLMREALGITGSQVSNVHVSVHGNALNSIVTVKVCEDFCTVALQHELDNGWRIIAVCPPNDRRRPDYILGHHERNPR